MLATLPACSHIVVLHDPLTAQEHNDLGVAYESGHKPDLAEREYRRALKQDSKYSVAKVNLGNLAASREKWSDAERWYRAALKDRPEDGDALNNLAVALTRQSSAPGAHPATAARRLDEAESLAQRAVATGARDSLYRSTLEEVRRLKRGGSGGGSP